MRNVFVLVTLAAVLVIAAPAGATNYYWNAGTASWHTDNWADADGVPITGWPTSVADRGYVYNSGTVQVGAAVEVKTCKIGAGGTYGGGTGPGNLTMTADVTFMPRWFMVGHGNHWAVDPVSVITQRTGTFGDPVSHPQGTAEVLEYYRLGQCDTTTSSTSHSACDGVPESGDGKHIISGGNLYVNGWRSYSHPGYLQLGRFFRVGTDYQRIHNFGGRGHLVIDNTAGNPIDIFIGNTTPGTDDTWEHTQSPHNPYKLQYAQTSDSILEVKLSSTGATATVDVNLDAMLSGTLIVDDAACTGPRIIGDTVTVMTTGGVVAYENLPETDPYWTTAGIRSIPDLVMAGDEALNMTLNPGMTEGFRLVLQQEDPNTGKSLMQSLDVMYTCLGDLSTDTSVGQADLDIVLAEWGDTVTAGSRPDPSGDGSVGQADLDAVLADWGGCHIPSSVPEPATLILLGLGGLALIRRRRS